MFRIKNEYKACDRMFKRSGCHLNGKFQGEKYEVKVFERS